MAASKSESGLQNLRHKLSILLQSTTRILISAEERRLRRDFKDEDDFESESEYQADLIKAVVNETIEAIVGYLDNERVKLENFRRATTQTPAPVPSEQEIQQVENVENN